MNSVVIRHKTYVYTLAGSTILYVSNADSVYMAYRGTEANSCFSMTEDFVIKYFWSAAGYGLMSIPLLFSKNAKATVTTNIASTMIASRTESTCI